MKTVLADHGSYQDEMEDHPHPQGLPCNTSEYVLLLYSQLLGLLQKIGEENTEAVRHCGNIKLLTKRQNLTIIIHARPIERYGTLAEM